MAIRRTREEKIRAQQRREQDRYEWKELSISSAKVKTEKLPSSDPKVAQERKWLKKDLLQTLVSFLLVLALLAYFYWRSLS